MAELFTVEKLSSGEETAVMLSFLFGFMIYDPRLRLINNTLRPL